MNTQQPERKEPSAGHAGSSTRQAVRIAACVLAGIVVAILSGAGTLGTGDAVLGVLAAVLTWIAFGAVEFAAFSKWARKPLQQPDLASPPWQRLAMRLYQSIRRPRDRAQQMQAELQWLMQTFEAVPDGWIVMHDSGEIEAINEPAQELLGLAPSDRHQNLLGLIRNPAIAELVRGDVESGIVEMASPVDETKRLELRRARIEGERDIILIRDVTMLNRLLTMRQDFVANVSHELRTPLTVIVGYLETLDEDDIDLETMRALMNKLQSPALRMKALVDDLLTLTRLESSPPLEEDFEVVPVAELLPAIVAEAEHLAGPEYRFELAIGTDARVLGIAEEIHGACTNLVSNAVRYSPDGGTIRVCWAMTERGPTFGVTDHGVGIAPEQISRLTERFYRVDLKDSRARGGTGLGLAIVKHVLRRHDTELEVESELGRGSTFSFVLPRVVREEGSGLVATDDGSSAPATEATPAD